MRQADSVVHIPVKHLYLPSQMVDTGGVNVRLPPLESIDDVLLRQEELGKIGAVLPRDTGDEGHTSNRIASLGHFFSV